MNNMTRQEWHDLKDTLLEYLHEIFTTIDFHFLKGKSNIEVLYYAIQDWNSKSTILEESFEKLRDIDRQH